MVSSVILGVKALDFNEKQASLTFSELLLILLLKVKKDKYML
jgi:hypothetical protein